MIPPIDWKLAFRVAGGIAGAQSWDDLGFDLQATGVRCEELVRDYSQLQGDVSLPPPEAVDRRSWTAANLSSMRRLLTTINDQGSVKGSPSLFAGRLKAAVGGFTGAEIGALVGYLSQRVLGQYDLALLDPQAPPRLLYVAPNIDLAGRQMDVDRTEIWQWVVLHELTHAVQFTAVPWLRSYLGGLVVEALKSADRRGSDLGRWSELLTSAERRADLLRRIQEGGALLAFATPTQRDLFNRIQAVMALVEGHAEHVMDRAGVVLLPNLSQLRTALERRRQSASPLAQLLNRLLGLQLKLRQYEQGKRFCDALVDKGGVKLLNRAWASPETVPLVQELTDPDAWVKRVT